MIKQNKEGKFQLFTSDGKRILGTHDSYEQALKQERAIQISKKMRRKYAAFAPGLPDRKNFGNIPRAQNTAWTLNIQRHNADKAGLHYDIRLNPPGSDEAYSWATKKLPGPGEKTTAVQQPVHTKKYLGFSGEIKKGYGKGTVQSIFLGPVDILKAGDDKIEFNRYKGSNTERYILLRSGGSRDWLFYNYTPTEESQAYKDIPSYKTSYKSISPKVVDPSVSSDEEVWSPKLDGAHNIIVLRPGKRPDIFSYRSSKKGSERIDHTFKTDIWKTPSPKSLGNTILRGELYVPGRPGNKTSKILNSNVWKAREEQKKDRPLDVRIFDVVKFKGKNVENAPYKEKLKMLREVSDNVRDLNLPPLAFTPIEKEQMFKNIMEGSDPMTQEGIVIYKMEQDKPVKVKRVDDYDVQITGTYPAKKGSKYDSRGIGGFKGIPEGSNTEIRFGSGLSDELRRSAFRNPDKFIGQ